jgi:cell division transport system permease protein
MAISVEYVAKETVNNLRRNVLMSTAAVLCVAVSLALVGMALLLKQGVANATIQWKNGVELSIFMKPDATPSQIQAVGTQLKGMPDVRGFSFIDKNQAFTECKKMAVCGTPEMADTVQPSDMPTSYRVKATHVELISQIGARFTGTAGVDTVEDGKKIVGPLLKVTRGLQLGLMFFALILLTSAALLILNTIRMAIFSRRREVAVMKLVGATNWFIRIPFMIEGMLQGLVGALGAFMFVYFLRNLLSSVAHGTAFNSLVVTPGEAFNTGILIVVIGAGVGAVGSAVAVSRFLDV